MIREWHTRALGTGSWCTGQIVRWQQCYLLPAVLQNNNMIAKHYRAKTAIRSGEKPCSHGLSWQSRIPTLQCNEDGLALEQLCRILRIYTNKKELYILKGMATKAINNKILRNRAMKFTAKRSDCKIFVFINQIWCLAGQTHNTLDPKSQQWVSQHTVLISWSLDSFFSTVRSAEAFFVSYIFVPAASSIIDKIYQHGGTEQESEQLN